MMETKKLPDKKEIERKIAEKQKAVNDKKIIRK